MKKYLLVIVATMVALVSCEKEIEEPTKDIDEPTEVSTVAFNLTAKHPGETRAAKSNWEAGDVIFVFFNNVPAPKFLKMSYDGSQWTSAEMDGSTAIAGALGLKNGDTGTMRAVFLPFGSDATVSASGTDFVFNKTWYAYYLTATLDYAVSGNAVSGAFNMMIPDDYVQFFVEDAAATDEAYTLGCDAVIPTGVASITSDGSVIETSDKTASDDMPGYAYSGGYLFSGKLVGSWGYGQNYYFARTKTADNSRADYFVTGKTLSSHSAVKLPANDDIYAVVSGIPNDGKWVPVGSGIPVTLYHSDLTTSLGTWHTCNYGQSVPEAVGTLYTFNDANSLEVSLPTKEQFESIINPSNCSYTWLTIHGQKGTVVKAAQGFLFLPAHDDNSGGYWSSTEGGDINYAWFLEFSGSTASMQNKGRNRSYPVRPVLNNGNTTFTAGTVEQGGSNYMVKDGITVSGISNAEGISYYETYGIIISAETGKIIRSITITCTGQGAGSWGPGNYKADGYSYTGHTGVWTGEASSVELSGRYRARITTIAVSYVY